MKKFLFFLFAALLCINFAVAANALDEDEQTPLVFVDITGKTPTSDFMEGFTVKNVSDTAIDLSDYKVWYGRTKTQEELSTLDPNTVTKFYMPLANEIGKYIIEPGEKAYIWIVTSSVYKLQVNTSANEKESLVDQGADGKPVYRIDNFRKAIEYYSTLAKYTITPIADDMLVVPLDITTEDAYGLDGTYTTKANYFNLQNAYFIRLYLTEYNARGADEAFCIADLDETNYGKYFNDSGAVASTVGTYVYQRVADEVKMSSSFLGATFLFGAPPQEEEDISDVEILPVDPAPEGAFRVLSLNVLNSDDKANRFDYIKKTVEVLSPDIIGFQECREGFDPMIDSISKSGYASVLSTLSDDPENNTLPNALKILYKTDKYTLIEDSYGARRFVERYGDSWTKSLCYCVLEEIDTKQRVIVINVHFEVYSSDRGVARDVVVAQREAEVREVLAQIDTMQEKYGELPVILTGDYNMTEVEVGFRVLLNGGLRDTLHIADVSYPFHSTSHSSLTRNQHGGYAIDHIMVTPDDFNAISVQPYKDTIGWRASDHYPVYADLEFKENTDYSCDNNHLAETPLQIIDATRRILPADALEGFTVLNVSDKPVDLSHILAWYGTGKTEADLKALDASKITSVMRLSERAGQYVLQPGEKAYIWINLFGYNTELDTANGTVMLIEKGDDGYPIYRTDLFREVVEQMITTGTYTVSMIEDSTLIVPLDRTVRDAYGKDGDYTHLASAFNFANTVYSRVYLTYDTAYNAEEAFCIADLDGTGEGTYLNEAGSVKVNTGTFKYVPSEDGSPLMKTDYFAKDTYFFGTNTDGFDIAVAAPEKTVVKMTIGKSVGYINDVAKTLDAAPIIRESRTMLPVRFVAEAFGAEVVWDGATSTATVKTAEVEIKITIGAKVAWVNGKEVALDAPAFIENSRTYMPVRFVAENLGATVAWDGATSTATLTK